MTRQNSLPSPTTNVDAVNLSRLLDRLQRNVLSSTADTKLLRNSYHRTRVAANLEYARTILLRLEHTSSSIKIPSRKQAAQADLLEKRQLIKRINERLYEVGHAADDGLSDSEESGPDDNLLGEEDVEESKHTMPGTQGLGGVDRRPPSYLHESSNQIRSRRTVQDDTRDNVATTTSSSHSPFASTSKSTDNTATTEQVLSSHANERETLTDALVGMATALKQSQLNIYTSLESEKSVLARAAEALERNTTGMEAAGKRMGVLGRMSEGKGWLGRMMLYAWIFGLMVVAILIVFVGPKFRF